MSHIPPNGGPPPPHYGYPAPPHPAPAHGAFAYVPAPVMMPVYPPPPPEPQPQPTYVTNYIYQQPTPPEPVTVINDPGPVIDWVPATGNTARSLESRAVVAGREGWDGSPLWAIRAHHSGNLIPGKLAVQHRAAFVPFGGKEVPVHNFEVLCAQPNTVSWLPASNGQVPTGAIAAGNTQSAEPLYIARVRHINSITPGKVHPSHGCCYISFGGSEVSYRNYEVLCQI